MRERALLLGAALAAGTCAPARAEGGRVAAPMLRQGPSTSLNWSGYAVTGAPGSVTDVRGSWTVPAVTCSGGSAYASFWAGLDGFDSKTVEQTGTDSDCVDGKPSYYAWFELYPKRSRITALAVSPGNVMEAEVKSVGGGLFQLTLVNRSTGQTFATTGKLAQAALSSAEWIAEAPSGGGVLPLADFGSVGFGQDTTGAGATCDATVGGRSGPVGGFGSAVQGVTMVSGSGATKAQPSALSLDGSSFSVRWVSPGP